MANLKRKSRISLGPVITIIILIMMTMIASSFFSIMEIGASKSVIANGTLESSSLIIANNALTTNGIITIISNAMTNLELLSPFFLLIMSLMAVGIGEASGLFQIIFKKFKKINLNLLLILTLFLGIISSIIGELSYILLLPLIAVIYEQSNKKPLLGILTMFIGISIGYGTGLYYNYDDILLGRLTMAAARATVDNTYIFHPNSNIYIMIVSTVILTISGFFIIKKYLVPKIGKNEIIVDDLKESKRGLFYSLIAFIIILCGVIYQIIPGLYKSGLLLSEGSTYLEKLLGSGAPFKEGLVFIYLLTMMICSYIYGLASGNLKDTNEYSLGLSANFEELGYLFVLLFFTVQLLGILDWTNITAIIGAGLVNLVSSLNVPTFLLIIIMFIVVVIIGIFIPGTTEKWVLLSPIMVPLFMKVSASPDFAQFVFKAADSVGKCITPLFIYFIILLAFLEKYNTNENKTITIFGTLKLIMPTILLLAGIWILIISGWYIANLPLGPGVSSIL